MRWKTAIMFNAFNDGETLGRLMKEARAVTENACDIFVVDDGSTDNTPQIIKENGGWPVILPQNMGVGIAYKMGFETIIKRGHYEYVVKIDADGQHQPKYIPAIIEALNKDYHLVVCSRFHSESSQFDTPKDRVFLNALFARELSQIIGTPVTDARSGFFGITVPLLKLITPQLIVPGYGIPMEVLLRSWWLISQNSLWERKDKAWHLEICHPALYDFANHGNRRRQEMYRNEVWREKIARFLTAYASLVLVLHDMGLPTHELTERISHVWAKHTEYRPKE